MLTDIFLYRYSKQCLWSKITELEIRLLNQAFSMIKDIFPYFNASGTVIERHESVWKDVHDRVCREIGLDELSVRYYNFTSPAPGLNGPVIRHQGFWNWGTVCENFYKKPFREIDQDADRYMKERLSFIELALRTYTEQIAKINESFPALLKDAEWQDKQPSYRPKVSGKSALALASWNSDQNSLYASRIDELNERFRRAGASLNYHNGFIQISSDSLIAEHIAKPFWRIVSDPLWGNVDIDIKEAIDRRDSNDKDPAIFAAKALESTIKIISSKKGWTRGNEKGASNYIDNLSSKNNGFISDWEAYFLKGFFSQIRNPLSHGPGEDPMPNLHIYQTDWVIETSMSWIRSLVRRYSHEQ